MAIKRVQSPQVYNNKVQLMPASIYSRGSLPVLYSGMYGVGQTGRTAQQQFEYTLRQMAVSPFSVNNKAYMKRIRNEYGIEDSGMYDALGTVGALVGGAVGFGLSAGYIKPPTLTGRNFFKPSNWTPGSISFTNTVSRRKAAHDAAFASAKARAGSNIATRDAIVNQIKTYNKNVNKATALKQADAFTAAKKTLVDTGAFENVKGITDAKVKEMIKAAGKTDNAQVAALKTYDRYRDLIKNADNVVDQGADALNAIGIQAKAGRRVSTKMAGFMPVVGTAADVASLGLSVAGLMQGIEAEDPLSIGLNSIAVAGDALAVAGDVMELGYALSWTGFGAAVGATGTVLSTIGGLVSAGVGALQGAIVGQTLGRSLSPEGMRAQGLYAANLYSGMVQRPITSLGTVFNLVALPALMGGLATNQGKTKFTRFFLPAQRFGTWLTSNALGNQARAGISMMALQGVSAITGPLDDKLPWAPKNPEDVNFVSAIALYGDINDNLFGATRFKSTLVGLAANDPNAMVNALARAWGRSDEIYKSVAFDDVREALGWNLSPIGNSLLSTIGELIIDPQNFNEVYQRAAETKLIEPTVSLLRRALNYTGAKVSMQDGKAIDTQGLELLVEKSGILNSRTSGFNRDALLSRIVQGYVKDGYKGIKEVVYKYIGAQDSASGMIYYGNNIDKQVAALNKTLDDILVHGTFEYNIGTKQTKEELKTAFQEYKTIQDKEMAPDTLTKEQNKMLDRVAATVNQLKRIYGENLDEMKLLDMFINDFGIAKTSDNASIMYKSFTPFREHMDVVDTLSQGISTFANPALTGVKALKYGWELFSTSRHHKITEAQKAKLLDTLNHATENMSKVYSKSMTELKAAEDVDYIKKTNKKFEEVMQDDIKKESPIAIEAKRIAEEQAGNIIKELEVEQANNTQWVAEQELKEEAFRGMSEEFIDKQPFNYTDRKTSITITIKDNEDYKEKLAYLEEFENKYKDNKEQIISIGKRANDTKVLTYIATNNAVQHYAYVNKFNTTMADIIKYGRTGGAILAELSVETKKAVINLLSQLHQFKYYVNSSILVKTSDILSEKIVEYKELIKKTEAKIKERKDRIQIIEDTLASYETTKDTMTDEVRAETEATNLILIKEKNTLLHEVSELEKSLDKYNNTLIKDVEARDALLDKYKNDPEQEPKTTRGIMDNTIRQDKAEQISLDTMETVANLFGADIVSKDDDGNDILFEGLRAVPARLKHYQNLELRTKKDFRHVILSHISLMVGSNNAAVMLLNNHTSFPADFTAQNWKQWTTEEKFKRIRQFLNSKDFVTPEAVERLYRGRGIYELVQKINDTVKKQIAGEDLGYTYTSLEDLSVEKIQQYLYNKMYAVEESSFHKKMVVVNHMFHMVNKEMNDAKLELKDREDYEQFERVLQGYIKSLNGMLEHNPAFKFLRSYNYSYQPIRKEEFDLFLTSDFGFDYLPDVPTKAELKEMFGEKSVYSEEEYMNSFINSEAMQIFLSKPEFSVKEIGEDIITKHNLDEDDATYVEAQKNITTRHEALKKKQELRAQNEERMDNIKDNVSKVIEAKDSPIHILNDLDPSTITNIPVNFNEKMFKDTRIKYSTLLRSWLTGQFKLDDLKFIPFLLSESGYFEQGEQHKTNIKYFHKLLDSKRYVSGGHKEQLKFVINRLLHLVEAKRISIDFDALEKMKLAVKATKSSPKGSEDYNIRLLYAAYQAGKQININLLLTDLQAKHLHKLFMRVAHQVTVDYMYEHANELPGITPAFPGDDDIFSKEQIQQFKTDVANVVESALPKGAIKSIVDEIYKRMNQELTTGTISKSQSYLTNLIDNELRSYEQMTIRGIGEKYYTLSRDVVKMFILGDQKHKDILNDFAILSKVSKDDNEDKILEQLKTPAMQVIYMMNKLIDVDNANKKELDIKRIVGAYVDKDTKRLMFLYDPNQKGIEESKKKELRKISLLNLSLEYHMNVKTIHSIRSRIPFVTDLPIEEAKALGNTILEEYYGLVHTYGHLVSNEVIHMSKEVFIAQGVTAEEKEQRAYAYEVLTDVDLNTVVNGLELADVLNTEQETSTGLNKRGKVKTYHGVDNSSRFKRYYNDAVMSAYFTATRHVLENESNYKPDRTKININGEIMNKPNDINTLFLMYVLSAPESRISDAMKRRIFRDVFFYESNTLSGYATETNIKNLKESITRNKNLQAALKKVEGKEDDYQKLYDHYALIIKDHELRIKAYEHIRDNLSNKDLRYDKKDPDKLYRYFKNNLKELPVNFNSTIGADEYPKTLAWDAASQEYVLVTHYDVNGEENIKKVSKGLESYNVIIGVGILKESNKQKANELNTQLRIAAADAYDTSLFKVTDYSPNGVVIVTETPEGVDDKLKGLLKKASKYDSNINNHNIFAVTAEQYKEIQEMLATDNWTNVYAYETIRDADNKIKGKISADVVNVKGNKVKTNAFVKDLQTIVKYRTKKQITNKEAINQIDEFIKLKNEYVVINPAHIASIDFNKSVFFQQAVKYAAREQAYTEFFEILSPDGVFNKFNIDVIARTFLQDQYIKQTVDGNVYNLKNLEKEIPTEILKQLKAIDMGNGKNLYDTILDAMKYMQEKYKDNYDIKFEEDDFLTKQFFDYTTKMENIASEFLHEIKNSQAAYPKISKALKQRYKVGAEWHFTAHEIGEMSQLSREQNSMWYYKDKNDKSHLDNTIINPYTYDRAATINKIKETKAYFSNKVEGYTGEHFIYKMNKARRERNKIYTNNNNRIILGKTPRMIFNNIRLLHDDIIPNGIDDIFKKEENIDKMMSLLNVSNEHLDKLISDTTVKVLQTREQEIQEYYEAHVPESGDISNLPVETQLRIVRENEVYSNYFAYIPRSRTIQDYKRYLFGYIVGSYASKVRSEVSYTPTAILGMKAFSKMAAEDPTLSAATIDMDALQAMVNKLIKEDAERVKKGRKHGPEFYRSYKLNETERMPLDTLLQYRVINSAPVEGVEHLTKSITDILNLTEKFVFYDPTHMNEEYKKESDKLKPTGYASMDDYLDSIKDEDVRNVTRFLIDLLIRKKVNGQTTEDIKVNYNVDFSALDVWHRGDNRLFLEAYDILRRTKKEKVKSFEGNFEMWTVLNKPLLDDDMKFKTFLENYLFGRANIFGEPTDYTKEGQSETLINAASKKLFSELGLNYEDTKDLFNSSKTLNKIINVLQLRITDRANMYTLINLINEVKNNYIAKNIPAMLKKQRDALPAGEKWQVTDPNQWHWGDAIYMFHELPIHEALRNVGILQSTGVFATSAKDDYFENSIIRGVHNSTSYYKRAMKYAADMNSKLNMIVVPNNNVPKHEVKVAPDYITVAETNIMTLARKQQFEYMQPLFKSIKTFSNYSKEYTSLERALGDVVLDSVAEAYAKTLNSVGSKNTIYQEIRTVFTEVIKALKGTEFKETDFVRALEVATGIQSISSQGYLISFYKKKYNEHYMTATPEQKVSADEAFKNTKDLFNKNMYLVDLTDNQLKAVIGFIMDVKYESGTESGKQKKRSENFQEFFKQQLDAEHVKALRDMNSMSNIIAGIKDVKQQLEIIFPQAKLDAMSAEERKQAEEYITKANQLHTLVNSELMLDVNAPNIHDTYEIASVMFDELVSTLPTIRRYSENFQFMYGKDIRDIGRVHAEVTEEEEAIIHDGLMGRINAMNKTQETYASSFGFTPDEQDMVNQTFADLESKIAKAQKDYEEAIQLIKEEKEAYKKIKDDIRFNLIVNNPGLLEAIQERMEQHTEALIVKSRAIYDKERAKRPAEFLEVFDKYMNQLYEKSIWFKENQKGYTLYNKLRSYKRKNSDASIEETYNTFKEDFQALGINGAWQMQTQFYKKFDDAIFNFNNIEKEIRKGPKDPIISAKGNTLSWKYNFDALYPAYVAYNNRVLGAYMHLEDVKEISILEDNVLTKAQEDVLDTYIKKVYQIFKDNEKKSSTEVSNLLNEETKDMTEHSYKKVKEKYTNYANKYAERIETLQNKALLLLPELPTDVTNIESSIESYLTELTLRLNPTIATKIPSYWTAGLDKKEGADLYKKALLEVIIDLNIKQTEKEMNTNSLEEETVNTIRDTTTNNFKRGSIKSMHAYIDNKLDKLNLTSFEFKEKTNTEEEQFITQVVNNRIIRKENKNIKAQINVFKDILRGIIYNKKGLEAADKINNNIKNKTNINVTDVSTAFIKAADMLRQKKGYENIPVVDITEFMLLKENEVTDEDDNVITRSEQFKKLNENQKEKKTELDKIVREKSKLNNFINNVNTIRDLKQEYANRKELLKKQRQEYLDIVNVRKESMPYNERTNIGTYKNLYKIPADWTTTDIIEDAIKRAATDFVGGEEALRAIIKHSNAYQDGDGVELHNAAVDVILSYANALAQMNHMNKTIPDKMVVLDMETVRNRDNVPVPYQMTLFIREVVEGKVQTRIINQFISNHVFEDRDRVINADGEVVEEKGTLLKAFYEQQKEMLIKENPNLKGKDDEINKRIDDLVAHVRGQSNDLNFVETFIRELNAASKDTTIVAHSGKNFDFIYYNEFIKHTANTLLVNMYYQNLRKESPKEIKGRVEELSKSSIMTDSEIDALIEKYKEPIAEIQRKAARGITMTTTDIEVIKKMHNEVLKLRTMKIIQEVETALGLIKNKKIYDDIFTGDNAEVKQLKDIFYNYLISFDTEKEYYKTELISRFQSYFARVHNDSETDAAKIKEHILKNLIEPAEAEYNKMLLQDTGIDMVYGFKSDSLHAQVSKTVQEKMETLKIPTENNYIPKQILNTYETKLQSIEMHLEYLRHSNTTDGMKRIQELQDENKAIGKEIIKLDKEITTLEKEILDIKELNKEYIQTITVASKDIQERTKNYAYRINKSIEQELEQAKERNKHRLGSYINLGLLRMEMDSQINSLQQTAVALEKIVKLLGTVDLEKPELIAARLKDPTVQALLKTRVDSKVFTITTMKEREELNAEYDLKINELLKYVSKLESGYTASDPEIKNLIQASMDKVVADIIIKKDAALTDTITKWNKYGQTFVPSAVDINQAYRTEDELIQDIKDNYKLLSEDSVYNKYKNNDTYRNLVHSMSKNSTLNTFLNVLKSKDSISNKLDTFGFRDIIIQSIKNDILLYEHSKQTLNKISFEKRTDKETSFEAVNQKVREVLMHAKGAVVSEKDLLNASIFNAIRGDVMPLKDMTEETLVDVASKTANDAMRDATKARHHLTKLNRLYTDVFSGDDRIGFMLNKEHAFLTTRILDDGSTTYTVTFVDDNYYTTQQYSFNSAKPASVRFDFNYSYNVIGGDEYMPSENKSFSKFAKDGKIDDYLNNLFVHKTKDGKTVPGITGLHREQIYKHDGVTDSSLASMKRLVTHYQKWHKKGLFKGDSIDNTVLDEFKKDVVDDLELKSTSLVSKNMTAQLKSTFNKHLDLYYYSTGKKNHKELNDIYLGISSKLLNKYSDQSTLKMINLIPDDFSRTYNIKWTEEQAKEMNVDLELSSEGSGNTAIPKLTLMSQSKLFTFNTNAIRSVLSTAKSLLNYTPIGIINDIYAYEDEIKQAGGAVDLNNYGQVIVDFVNNSKEHKDLRSSLLIKTYKDETTNETKYINTLTPNVVTRKEFNRYKKDVLHKIGINMEVGFIDHPDAFEDSLLIDAAHARAFEWGEGNKTWLGLMYGFKGGVVYVEGLHDRFGVSIVANRTSIVKRGSYGARLEMITNSLRKYLLRDTTKMPELESIIGPRDGGDANQVAFIKELEALIHIEEGKFIGDPGLDYNAELSKLFAKYNKDYTNVIYSKIANASPVEFTDSKGNVKSYDLNGFDIERGELYVIMDAEHTAESMQTKTVLDDAGEISFVYEDVSGSVKGGGALSASVATALEAKGVKWDKAFISDEPHKQTTLYSKIFHLGTHAFLSSYAVMSGELYDIGETLSNLKEKDPNILVDDFERYMTVYNESKENATLDETTWYKTQLKSFDQIIMNKAHDLLTGKTGAIYSSRFRRHNAIRQQLLANTRLGQGELRTSNEGWKTLIKMDDTWLQKDQVELDAWLTLLNGHELINAKKFKNNEQTNINADGTTASFDNEQSLNKFIQYLESVGITNDKINGMDDVVYEVDKNTNTINFKQRAQKYGYVIAVRSPVQDYNSVPTVKVIGYHTHSAVEANPYLYKMIGGDNDGDTIAMIALNAKQYIAGNFKINDATSKDYYDEGYKTKVEEDLVETEILKKSAPIGKMDIRYAAVGKSTFDGIRTHYTWGEIFGAAFDGVYKDIHSVVVNPASLKWTDADKVFFLNVAIREMYNSNVIDGIFNIADYKDISKVNKLLETNGKLMTLAAQHYLFESRLNDSDPLNSSDYDFLKYVKAKDFTIHDKHLSEADKKTIRDIGAENLNVNTHRVLFEKIFRAKTYNITLYNTIARIRASKVGINIFGGNRKHQSVGSIMSTFTHINRDKSGNIWNAFRNNKGNLTVASLAVKLFKDSHVHLYKVNSTTDISSLIAGLKPEIEMNLKEIFKDNQKHYDLFIEDLDDVMRMVIDTYRLQNRVEEEMKSFVNVLAPTNPTLTIADHFEKYYKKADGTMNLNPFYLEMYKKFKQNPEAKLDEVDKEYLYVFYFGKHAATAKRFAKLVTKKFEPNKASSSLGKDTIEAFIEEQRENYTQQHIIDRRLLGNQSIDASDIIGVAKHGAINLDIAKFMEAYIKRVTISAHSASIRKLTLGDDPQHNRALAIAMDSNPFEHNNIKRNDKELNEDKKKQREATLKSSVQIKTYYNSEADARSNYNALIDNYAKVELFNSIEMPNRIYKNFETIIESVLEAFNSTNNIFDALNKKVTLKRIGVNANGSTKVEEYTSTVNDLLGYLLMYKIPAYRLLRVLTFGYGTHQTIKQTYGGEFSVKSSKYLKNGAGMFALLLKLQHKEAQKDLENMLPAEYSNAVNFFLNNKDVDLNYQETDIYGNIKRRKSNTDSTVGLKIPNDYIEQVIHNIYGELETSKDVIKAYRKEENPIARLTLLESFKKLNLQTYQHVETLEEIVESLFKESSVYSSMFKDLESRKEQATRSTSINKLKLNIMNRATNFKRIEKYIDIIGEAYNNIRANEIKLKELHNKLRMTEGRKLYSESTQENKTTAINYLEGVTNIPDAIKRLETMKEEVTASKQNLLTMMAGQAFQNNIGSSIRLIVNDGGKGVQHLYSTTPRYAGERKEFIEDDLKKIHDTNLMKLERYQVPFLHVASLFRNGTKEIIDNNGNKKIVDNYNWNDMFEHYKENHRFSRITIIKDAEVDEGLIIKLRDRIQKEIKDYDKMSKKEQKKAIKENKFKSDDDIIAFNNAIKSPDSDGVMKIDNIPFKGIDKNQIEKLLGQDLAPTLKELIIKRPEDLEAIYDFMMKQIETEGKLIDIGFVSLENFMNAYEVAYKPFMFSGSLNKALSTFAYLQKLGMRMSFGFLFRNIMDTWTQLYSQMYTEMGAYGMIKNSREIIKYVGFTSKLYSLYQDISEERLLTLLDTNTRYEHMIKTLNNLNGRTLTDAEAKELIADFVYIKERIDSYEEALKHVPEKFVTRYIKKRRDDFKTIKHNMESINTLLLKTVVGATSYDVLKDSKYVLKSIQNLSLLKGRKDLENIMNFFLNTRFSEYFVMYDYLKFDTDTPNKHRKSIEKWREQFVKYRDKEGNVIYTADFEDVQHIIFEINAFMQTNAQIDSYRQEHFKYLRKIVAQRKANDENSTMTYSYLDTIKQIKEQKETFTSKTAQFFDRPYKFLYHNINEWIENTARIGGYLFDRYLYGYSFDETVNRSLKRWFNYGSRSPLEMQLLADIPYLSFPIRSIDNWIERLSNPKFLRLVADIMDGVYSQYEDEDGQLDRFTQFQMQNGWLPIGANIGLRVGFGMYDVQNILSNPGEVIQQRTNPILRGLQKLIFDQDAIGAIKSLATVGIITRTANAIGPRGELQLSSPQFVNKKPYSIGTATSFTFEYEGGNEYKKYTPYKYRYKSNGRWKRYENIYKDWFNKYGKMRKPTVDPMSLVKDIQWKQYVRYRKSQTTI